MSVIGCQDENSLLGSLYNVTFNQARASAAEALAVVITPEERPLPY